MEQYAVNYAKQADPQHPEYQALREATAAAAATAGQAAA